MNMKISIKMTFSFKSMKADHQIFNNYYINAQYFCQNFLNLILNYLRYEL